MFILRQSTAVDVLIGPFVDGTDGVSTEEAVSPSVQLSKNGQTAATKNEGTTPAHDNAGYYNCIFDVTDTGTVGTLVAFVEGSTSTFLQVRHEFQIVDTAAFDAMFADGAEGPLQATTVGRTLDIAATGEVSLNFGATIGTLDAAQFGADFITSAKIAPGAFVADNFAASSLDGKGDWNTVTPDAAGVAPTAAEIVDAWETQSQADPTGFHVNVIEVAGVAQDLATATELGKVPKSDGTSTWNATALGAINTQADLALTDYDPPTRTEATSDKAEIITDLDDIKGTSFVKDTHSLIDIETFVDILDDGTSGNVKIASDAAAIKTKTDSLTFTKANEVDGNTQSINGAAVVGDGNSTPWDGA